MTNSRLAAIKVLCQWQESRSAIDLSLGPALEKINDPRDRHLVTATVHGVLRRLTLVDWVIERYSRHPLAKMKPLTINALRVGVAQLLFMDRLPPSAVINEVVKALRKQKQPRWLTGFVNGLLRRVDRERAGLMARIAEGKLPDTARLCHPGWLLARWQARYGVKRAEEICRANSREAGLCLRANGIPADGLRSLFARHGVAAQEGKFVPEAVWLPGFKGAIDSLPGFDRGLFFVQDEIAQLLCCLLPESSRRVLDGCAGLGGKTALLAGRYGTDKVTAVEPDARRFRLLDENLRRLGAAAVRREQRRLGEFASAGPGEFDAVLIDAPCSGLGVTGRHPDIRWNREARDLPRLRERQLALLGHAAGLVCPGGVLVYATCSTEPEENDDVVAMFLQRQPGFTIENPAAGLPSAARRFVGENGFFRTLPGRLVSDGFFAARLRRRG